MQEQKLVVLVAVQSKRQLYFVKPELLIDREPLIFEIIREDNKFIPTGPYCAITFSKERRKRSRWSYKRDGVEKPIYENRRYL